MCANWCSWLGRGSGVAPMSSTTIGPSREGSGCTIAGPEHARQAAQLEQARREHGARRAGRDGGLGASLAHEAHAGDDGGVVALARGARRLLVVQDHVRRVHDLDLRIVAHERLELLRGTAEQHAQISARHRGARSRDDLAPGPGRCPSRQARR